MIVENDKQLETLEIYLKAISLSLEKKGKGDLGSSSGLKCDNCFSRLLFLGKSYW